METIMEMDLLALVLFIVTIVLAFIRKVNIGILAIAVGAIAVRIFGLTDKQLISGISSSMFCTLVGITFLFAVVKSTGALDLLAEKISYGEKSLASSDRNLHSRIYCCWCRPRCNSRFSNHPGYSRYNSFKSRLQSDYVSPHR